MEVGTQEMLMTELMEGSLADVSTFHGRLSPQDLAHVALQVAQGIAFLHSRHIIHRDLKEDNILVTEILPPLDARIADFGLARSLAPGDALHDAVGTRSYCAPEMFLGSYDHKADVWSFGVLLYALLFGQLPWTGRKEEVRQVVERQQLEWGGLRKPYKPARRVLEQLLQRKPLRRSTAATAVQQLARLPGKPA